MKNMESVSQTELKAYQDETIRLKHMLQQYLRMSTK